MKKKTIRPSRIVNRPPRRVEQRSIVAIDTELASIARREAELDAEAARDIAAYEAGDNSPELLGRALNRFQESARLNDRRWHLQCRREEVEVPSEAE